MTALIGVGVFFVRKYLAQKQVAQNGTGNHLEDHWRSFSNPEYLDDESFTVVLNNETCIWKRTANPAFSGEIPNHPETGNETNENLPNISDETLRPQLPTLSPIYITRVENTFSSEGGKLCAPLDSDVSIIVDVGTIPDGMEQRIFFGVICNEEELVRDVPITPTMSLISPVIECGPHNIELLKPVKIIVPHCLDLGDAKKEWVTVYRCEQFSHYEHGLLIWEKVPNYWEKSSKSKAWFSVKKDSIKIKTTTFSLWCIFACRGARRKRVTVFASKPDPQNDLVYLRFYLYNDSEDSKKRVEERDRARFPGSWASREEPFKIYNDNRVITVKILKLQEGWVLDKTNDTQIFNYQRINRNRFRTKGACDFAAKPEDGRDVEGFSCKINFQQDDHEEHEIYINPGFTPLKRQIVHGCLAEASQSIGSSCPCDSGARGGSSSSATATLEDENRDNNNQEGKTSPDFPSGLTIDVSSLGSEPATERHFRGISCKVGASWKKVLRELTIDNPTIENLEEDYSTAAERFYQGLLAWKGKVGCHNATIGKLKDALRGCSEALKALSTVCAAEMEDKPNCSYSLKVMKTPSTFHFAGEEDAPNTSEC